MPKILQYSHITTEETHLYVLAMTIYSLGDRSHWPITNSVTYFQVCYGHSRLLYKVGRSQTAHYDL